MGSGVEHDHVWPRRRAAVGAKMVAVRKTPAFTMERYGRLPEMDRSFDIAYWQRLGPTAIFEAAWQMAVDAQALPPGDSHELRLRRTVENFQRPRS
jgi:hypothetical protein